MITKVDFESMNRNELAHYIVAHRDSQEGIAARRAYIRQMAEKAKKHGIELHQAQVSTLSPNDKDS
jgi:hypothetical protein